MPLADACKAAMFPDEEESQDRRPSRHRFLSSHLVYIHSLILVDHIAQTSMGRCYSSSPVDTSSSQISSDTPPADDSTNNNGDGEDAVTLSVEIGFEIGKLD